jgi:hypothetical protein
METNTVFVLVPSRLASTIDEIFWQNQASRGQAEFFAAINGRRFASSGQVAAQTADSIFA